MSTIRVDNILKRTGTGVITLGQSGDTIALGSGASQTGFGGVMTPSFQAYMSSSQTLSNNTDTLLQYNTEEYDTASAYDNSSNYRFTPQTAGKYFIYATALTSGDANSSLIEGWIYLRKNGSKILESRHGEQNNYGRSAQQHISTVVDFNGSSDYVDVYGAVNQSGGTPTIEGGQRFTRFGAYKIIE